MKYDVFISYIPQDQHIAGGIFSYLEARGLRCFLSSRDIARGVVRATGIVEGLESSSMMVAVYSDGYNQSPRVDREIEIAAEDNKAILLFMTSYSDFKGAKRFYFNNSDTVDGVFNPDEVLPELYQKICQILGKTQVSERGGNMKFGEGNISQDKGLVSNLEFDPRSGTFKDKSTVPNPPSQQNIIYPKSGGFVDLGLPSGIKWATCNVGANSPEEFGHYFAWGEITTKSSYSQDNSATYGLSNEEMLQRGYMNYYGNVIITRDVVCRRYGGSCRMPSKKDFEELINYTYWHWTTYNGVWGYQVRSRNNFNKIFIPACGRMSGFRLGYSNESGCYWSSTPSTESAFDAYCLDFFSRKYFVNRANKYRGLCVRPIAQY